jgi:hypothetical protein
MDTTSYFSAQIKPIVACGGFKSDLLATNATNKNKF